MPNGQEKTGQVKWFNNAKGFGFIVTEGVNEDLFVHYSQIQMNGYKTLKAGQEVTFELIQGPKGYSAKNVSTVGFAEESEHSVNSEPNYAPEEN